MRNRIVNVQQVDKMFVPMVTVVQTGTPVSATTFPLRLCQSNVPSPVTIRSPAP